MKRILQLCLICCLTLSVAAQKNAPKWMTKAAKAVCLVKTYGKEGEELASGTAVFTSGTGEAIASYTLFKGAAKAIVINNEGKNFQVTRICGADEMYDVIKFQVEVPKKTAFLPIATEPIANGAKAYLLPYSVEKKPVFKSGAITEVSNLKDSYKYYKLAIPMEDKEQYTPLLTEDGQLFALTQADAGGSKELCYGISAGYVNSLTINPTAYITETYRNIDIPKSWPQELEQATIALYLLIGTQDPQTCLITINDFIATFPNAPEGYLSRSEIYAHNREALSETSEGQMDCLAKALADVQTAGKLGQQKGEIWYNQAKLISKVALSDTTLTDPAWTIEAAMDALDKAIAEEDLPIYHQLKADIYVNKEEFQKAYDEYEVVNNSDVATSSSYYMAAKIKERIPGFNIGDIIVLLDKAIEKSGTDKPIEAATYVMERVEWRLRLTQYKEAIADYDLYYTLMEGKVFPNFFYLREQAKFRAGDLEGALKDIQAAIQANPRVPDYHAEAASVLIRLQKYEDALNSLNQAIQLAPDFASCYRLRGVCYVRQGKKNEACEAFYKAKELGDPVADKLIKEHCK